MRDKLALGTVQFGLDYGVTNNNGQVTIKEARKILGLSRRNNIKTLDTAASYGDSEKVLGQIGVSSHEVITKTIPLQENVDKVINHFYKSLENMNLSRVKGLLVHDVNDIRKKNFTSLFKELSSLKREGIINQIGFSIYTPEQANELIDKFEFDLIQLPINVFDTRLIKGRQLRLLNDRGIEIHARSVFLQGLLLDLENIPGYFSEWKEKFLQYQEMVSSSRLSLLEYALSFVCNIKEIDKVIVGVNSEDQLTEITKSVKEHRNLEPFPINDIKLLNPSMWKL